MIAWVVVALSSQAGSYMSVNTPQKLYRYRPLTPELFQREVETLRQSYLYAAPFASMNDPMEAFYETGSSSDRLVNDLYGMLRSTTANFALVSFSATSGDLPLWAYYASNFAGMCLEFDTGLLSVGDFQNEGLHPVTYALEPLPPLDLASVAETKGIVARICRKRSEWAHEKEWRYVTGTAGPKHYLDDALTRVFLGPRVAPEHAKAVCDALKSRPVEVLQGHIDAYRLTFETLQSPCPLSDCERVGAGTCDPDSDWFAEEELRSFLGTRFDELVDLCSKLAKRPNMEGFSTIAMASGEPPRICVVTIYRLRGGGRVYDRAYLSKELGTA